MSRFVPSFTRALVSPALALVLPLIARGGETEWPQFRGPTGQGISKATGVPKEWSETSNVAWKIETPGQGWSSPVISRGKIYLTSAIKDAGGETTLNALCFQESDGKLLWNSEVLRPDPALLSAMHRKNTLASPTPIIAGERIYVHFGHMGSAALDLDGKVIWRQTELSYAPTHGNGGSQALVGDLLIFSADGNPEPFVAALDVATGAVRWKTARNTLAKKHFSFSTPLAIEVGGKPVVISAGSGFVAGYDIASGAERWKVTYGEGYSVVPRPVYAHGLLYISTGFDKPWVYAIRPEGAEGDVTATNVQWTHGKGAPNTPSMVVVGDELYFVADSGIASCADARTGEIHWSERLGGNFSASPVLAGGRIYFLNETGGCYVVKPGKIFEREAVNELGEKTLASPAPIDGALVIRSEAHLWKIAAKGIVQAR